MRQIVLPLHVLVPENITEEQKEVLEVFAQLLVYVTSDGGAKRAKGEKPSWKVDTSHWAAMFSHINKRMHGEKIDPDSGTHTFVHLAWRALAIAWQELEAMKQGVSAPPIVMEPKNNTRSEAERDEAAKNLAKKLHETFMRRGQYTAAR